MIGPFRPRRSGVRSTSSVTVSPSSTPRPSTGSYRAARPCSCVSVCSTAFSSSVTAGRRSEIVFSGPGIDGRQRLERGGKRERLPFVERHVLHVGRVDRLEAALAQRLVDGARDQVVRDVVENLLAESLLDERRRNLALAESGNARLPAVAAGDAIDFGVDDVARNFDGNALLGFSEIGEFGFHYRIIPWPTFALRSGIRFCMSSRPAGASEGWKGGVEPPRPFGHRILSPARLPVPPLSHARSCPGTTM